MPDYKALTEDELHDRWINAVNALATIVQLYKELRLENAASGRSEITRSQLRTAHNDILQLNEKIARCHAEARRRSVDEDADSQ